MYRLLLAYQPEPNRHNLPCVQAAALSSCPLLKVSHPEDLMWSGHAQAVIDSPASARKIGAGEAHLRNTRGHRQPSTHKHSRANAFKDMSNLTPSSEDCTMFGSTGQAIAIKVSFIERERARDSRPAKRAIAVRPRV